MQEVLNGTKFGIECRYRKVHYGTIFNIKSKKGAGIKPFGIRCTLSVWSLGMIWKCVP